MKESPFIREMQDEARIEMSRAYILEILQRRFGAEAAALAPPLEECTDLDRLKRLFRLALDCASVKAFRNALR